MKIIKFAITLLSLTLSLNVSAATRYVSDDVFIYLHSGPSLDYRIIGTIKVGASVTTLKYDDSTKFMQVKTQAGKTGWVNNKELQKSLPAKTMLPAVQKELKQAQAKLSSIAAENDKTLADKIQSISDKEGLITALESEKIVLQKTIDELKARNLELDLLQDTKDERVKMEWLLNGGGVLLFGLLLGLLIPFIPRRKKRQNNW
ncbi:TIGR04211 family SH3 domain-containing protein [Psychromonas ossibalaenae]|uniref:TIGR04211 family SH3 domain-containing protein n=1 Tax=Psychromonas ossibalaenae TaxID=444922 RepID=UPI00035D6F38|nr:TIGR04211 family SH3 domain-containing protein [Psychromonas ossibalaenae]